MSDTKFTYREAVYLHCPHVTQADPDTAPSIPRDSLMIALTRKPESQTNTILVLCPICASTVKGHILEHVLTNAARASFQGWR
jgi:hypothetical protein